MLEGPEQTAIYFDATTDAAWRTRHTEWSDGLARAPVVLLAYASADAYVDRYARRTRPSPAWVPAPSSGPSPIGSATRPSAS